MTYSKPDYFIVVEAALYASTILIPTFELACIHALMDSTLLHVEMNYWGNRKFPRKCNIEQL
jgi:hypothetical protein